MVMTDNIADMLTRIRNANQMHHLQVVVPISKLKVEILKVLKEEGFIKNFFIKEFKREIIISLKYTIERERVIKGLKKISKPGLKVYTSVEKIPKVLSGLGIALISTNKGILTDNKARLEKVGGEVLAYIW
ncbi:30S ribosomal protein S8 [Candidatus Phytoplasma mali]|uniref:Small ribosomal subunit protein uS8 n=1 Tax=Phytoplasma mali (strain AT) TaxID=482235 RepID=RS8_PHYMT|nr:30S ribosomal protein S8 [Candidatus Phytoplasma mali]B3R005.1 RecName: Full=Small ribosomal subunit protein uS8; AltName: Full=30S ribosomal protein S8 [Candidatus Phytoplasma mali AT]CAP18542.1 30S ribosomal protein S8 [Candidatus Phytoplasma mali]